MLQKQPNLTAIETKKLYAVFSTIKQLDILMLTVFKRV